MRHRWPDAAEALLVEAAAADLKDTGEVQPALIAFTGQALRFVAWLRPFAEGQHHQPLVELLALAGPLGCDRLMVSLGGRVWPRDRPAAARHGDRGHRALVVHAVEGTRQPPHAWTALRPVVAGAGDTPALAGSRDPGPAQGWVSQALLTAVRQRQWLAAPWPTIAEQAARVDALGHALYLPPELLTRLARTRPGE
jgi:hypothetical protein